MQNQPLVLCIPRVSTTITREQIIQVITKMNIGDVETLHEIPLQQGNNYKRIIIRIKWDRSSRHSQRIHSMLSENKSIKIVYSMPWYWICVKYVKQGSNETKRGLDPSLAKLLTETQ